MKKPILEIEVTLPEHPVVYFFKPSTNKKKSAGSNGFGKNLFKNVTSEVKKLEIVPVEGAVDKPHILKRLNSKGDVVWETTHQSLKETFWHAKWEYEIEESAWEKSKLK